MTSALPWATDAAITGGRTGPSAEAEFRSAITAARTAGPARCRPVTTTCAGTGTAGKARSPHSRLLISGACRGQAMT